MDANITKQDVFLYFANKLDRARRREIETASQTDAEVQQWLAEFTPTDEELRHEPVPVVAAAGPAYRQIASMTYQSVERDEPISAVASLFVPESEATDGIDRRLRIPTKTLCCGDGGRLAYRAEVLRSLAADHRQPLMTPIDIPCIQPDFVNDRLTIRQWATDELRSGVIRVFAAKMMAPGKVERFGPVRVEMEKETRMDGRAYWCKEIPIRSLVPRLEPSDDVVFYAEPVDGSDEKK